MKDVFFRTTCNKRVLHDVLVASGVARICRLYRGMTGARTFSTGATVESDKNFFSGRQHGYLQNLVNITTENVSIFNEFLVRASKARMKIV